MISFSQMGNFPAQDSGYQLPPGTTAAGGIAHLSLDDGYNPQGGAGGGGGGGHGGDQACFMWQQGRHKLEVERVPDMRLHSI